jgi:large subunit ribosomal protein L15
LIFALLQKHILLARKDPNQVFYGLEPGWVINLRDKEILVPQEEELQKYYDNA